MCERKRERESEGQIRQNRPKFFGLAIFPLLKGGEGEIIVNKKDTNPLGFCKSIRYDR